MLTSRVCSSLRPLALQALVGSLLIASSSFALQSPFESTPSHLIEWPDDAAHAVPTRAITGEFTGDFIHDALYLTGTSALLVYGPAYYHNTVSLPGLVRDMALVPRTGTGAADRILLLDDLGLRVLNSYSAGSFVETRLNTGGAWSTAKRVIVADADDDGWLDAIGVAADGMTILFSSNVLSGADNPDSFTLGHQVLDLVVARWSPFPAIAALTVGGLYVREWDGKFVDEWLGGTYEAAHLAVFRDAGLAYQRTAAVYTVGGLDYLSVVDQQGPAEFFPLGTAGSYSLNRGDVDGNGHEDLVVLQRLNHEAIFFTNSGVASTGVTFGAFVGMGLPNLTPSNLTATPIFADFSNDGDVDLLVHVYADDPNTPDIEAARLLMIENETFARRQLAPVVLGGDYHFSFINELGTLNLTVDMPMVGQVIATDLEVVVWTQDDTESQLDPAAVDHEFFSVDPATNVAEIEFDIVDSNLTTDRIHHFDIRAVKRVAGVTTNVGPSAIWSFATGTVDVTALEDISGFVGKQIRIFLVDEQRFLTASEEDDRILTPSAVEGKDVPPSDEPIDPFAN